MNPEGLEFQQRDTCAGFLEYGAWRMLEEAWLCDCGKMQLSAADVGIRWRDEWDGGMRLWC